MNSTYQTAIPRYGQIIIDCFSIFGNLIAIIGLLFNYKKSLPIELLCHLLNCLSQIGVYILEIQKIYQNFYYYYDALIETFLLYQFVLLLTISFNRVRIIRLSFIKKKKYQ